MKRLLLIYLTICIALTIQAQQSIMVKKGDAQSLLDAIQQANTTNADTNAQWFYILIPDGLYDLGERVLTPIKGHHIALIGQSMTGTIVRNAPDRKIEGISKTAVFKNTGSNNYFQDMTIQNALDYYAEDADGRAVTLHDKGTRTICNRVRLLSYQDTYYSDNEDCQHYFKDSEIHGTVDFICGAGDVWFESCRIVTEKRTKSGEGRCVIAAPRTSKTQWGYVFYHCTIENMVSNFEYARGWHTHPRCTWLYTTLLTPEKLSKTRFDYRGMRTVQNNFKEYATMDAQGRNITPASNVVTFTLKDEKNPVETILTDQEAKQFKEEKVFADWKPALQVKKIERKAQKLMKRLK